MAHLSDGRHYHANERIDGGHPVNNGTDRHRDCIVDSLRAILPAFALLGWELTKWDVVDLAGNTSVEFTSEDGCGIPHVLSITVWACACTTGETELRNRQRRLVSHLN